MAGVRVDRRRAQPRIRPRQQHRDPREPQRTRAAAEQRHDRAGRAPSTACSNALRQRPDAAVDRPAAGRRQRPRGALVRADDSSVQRAAAEALRGRAGPDRRRDADAPSRTSRTGSAAPACWCAAPMRKPSACSTSAISCMRRTSISAPPSARAAAQFCSRRRWRSSTCAGVRRRRRRQPPARVPAQPASPSTKSITLAGRRC